MSEPLSSVDALTEVNLVVQGKAALSDFLGDLVIFRKLEPMDSRLPGLKMAWQEMGLPDSRLPRKAERAYAVAVTWLLRQAQTLENPGKEIKELVYLGDTALLDAQAYRNLLDVSGWPGWAFIGSEQAARPPVIEEKEANVTLSNRWAAIYPWLMGLLARGARLDEHTAVVVDIDKTALGARGRNSKPIDDARMEGVERTVQAALGDRFDRDLFRQAYNELNQPAYHSFTADNQDYLAYICLIIGAGYCSLEELTADVQAGRMVDFAQFIRWADVVLCRRGDAGLRDIHHSVYARFQAGDPTPFKAFRREEYRATVARMGHLPDDVPVERRVAEEICLTAEVAWAMRWLRERGALLLALSDKPDEASIPRVEEAAEGALPLHRVVTHIVGAAESFDW